MTLFLRQAVAAAALIGCAGAASAAADIQITEWMYSGANGEFFELTNVGTSAVDFSGWSFDDDSRLAGTVSLSSLGVVQAGESVIVTETDAASFRSAWGLSSSVKVLGSNTVNLGRSDEINIFDASNVLVDRFTYSDQSFAGTIRTQNVSGTPGTLVDLASQTVTTGWVLAASGDAFGSHASSGGDLGNPGAFALASAVPEPQTYALMLSGLLAVSFVARKRRG